MKKILFSCLGLFLLAGLAAQENHPHPHGGRPIEFPDIPGYRTLKCDFHMHTVFSDGNVWPTIRVEEAIKDGLDAIALTEHIEYQPHKEDIPHPDRNRAFHIAREFAKAFDLIVVPGTEITRKLPPGHSNAIFVEDVNKLIRDDAVEVFREARRQGAFVFWNHPNWTAQAPDGIARLTDLHRQLIGEGLLNGIEVVNDVTYSEEALQLALENNLTVMGTSDIHGLVDWQYAIPEGGHRPVTLVFATEKSEAAIREALFAGRTVAWFNNLLIGREEYLLPLLSHSLQVDSVRYTGKTSIAEVQISNHSDAEFFLQNLGPYTFHAHADLITVPPHATTTLEVKTIDKKSGFLLKFRVLNAVTAPNEHPVITLPVEVREK